MKLYNIAYRPIYKKKYIGNLFNCVKVHVAVTTEAHLLGVAFQKIGLLWLLERHQSMREPICTVCPYLLG